VQHNVESCQRRPTRRRHAGRSAADDQQLAPVAAFQIFECRLTPDLWIDRAPHRFLREQPADAALIAGDAVAHLRLLAGRVPFIAGPHLNIYNNETLAWFAELGASRFVLPLELSRDILRELQAARPAGIETEVFAYGRMPLAFSARCFTARHYNLPKDDCQFRCLDDADGLALNTRDKDAFLTLNGIQTQSALVYDLSESTVELRSLGVDVVRISPQSHSTIEIIDSFRERCAGRVGATLEGLRVAPPCNGYWYGVPGMEYRTSN